jgi:hypothetical protein
MIIESEPRFFTRSGPHLKGANGSARPELVRDDEVHSSEIVGEPPLPAGPACRFEPIDEIDGVEEAAARAGAKMASLYARAADRKTLARDATPMMKKEHA